MVRLRQQNSSFLLLEASHIKRKIDGNSYLINWNFDTYNSLTPNWYYKVSVSYTHLELPAPQQTKALPENPNLIEIE